MASRTLIAAGMTRSELVARDEMSRGAESLRVALGRCRRSCSSDCREAASVARKIKDGRIRLPEHATLLHYDAFAHDALDADLEGFWLAGLEMVRGWMAKRERGEPVDLPEELRRLTEAEMQTVRASMGYLADRTPKSLADLRDALRFERSELDAVTRGLAA